MTKIVTKLAAIALSCYPVPILHQNSQTFGFWIRCQCEDGYREELRFFYGPEPLMLHLFAEFQNEVSG